MGNNFLEWETICVDCDLEICLCPWCICVMKINFGLQSMTSSLQVLIWNLCTSLGTIKARPSSIFISNLLPFWSYIPWITKNKKINHISVQSLKQKNFNLYIISGTMKGSSRSILDLTTLLYTGVVPLVFTKKTFFLGFHSTTWVLLKKKKKKRNLIFWTGWKKRKSLFVI